MMNKRGEKLLTFWWFIVLTFVVVGIVGGVSLISYKEIDVKRYEAEVLSLKLERCLIELGKLKVDVLGKCSDLNSVCGLNGKMFNSEGIFFYKLELTDDKGRVLSKYDCGSGDVGLEPSCLFDSEIKIRANNFPVCFQRDLGVRFYDSEDGKWIEGNLKIVSGSNQKGRVAV